MKTAYDVLGLTRDAAPVDIEHRYHRALNAYHARGADQPPTKEERKRLRELREAYLVLSSPSQRQAYDFCLQARAQRRGRIMYAIQAALALLLLLGGVLLLAVGSYATVQRGDTAVAGAPERAEPHAQALAARYAGIRKIIVDAQVRLSPMGSHGTSLGLQE